MPLDSGAVEQHPGNTRCLEIGWQASVAVEVANRLPPIRELARLAGRPLPKELGDPILDFGRRYDGKVESIRVPLQRLPKFLACASCRLVGKSVDIMLVSSRNTR
jgi:hypothetical protein